MSESHEELRALAIYAAKGWKEEEELNEQLRSELQATAELAVKYREALRQIAGPGVNELEDLNALESRGVKFLTIAVFAIVNHAREALALEPTDAMKRLEKKG